MGNLVLLLAEEIGNKEFFNVQDVQEIMRDNMVSSGTASRAIWELKETKYNFEDVCDKADNREVKEDVLNKDIISKSDLILFAQIMLKSISEDCGIDRFLY